MIVSDQFQRRGIGTGMVRQLVDFARDEKLTAYHGHGACLRIVPMQKVFERLGFRLEQSGDTGVAGGGAELCSVLPGDSCRRSAPVHEKGINPRQQHARNPPPEPDIRP